MYFLNVLEAKGWYFLTTLLGGWPETAGVAAASLVFALIVGLVIALLRLSRWRVLRFPAIAYVEFFRGTPALVQLFVIYFGLPDTGFQPSPLQAAIVGLGLNGAAYLSEIYRAGIESIHRGQMEAALSLGMTPAKAMAYIILPQAVRRFLPPWINSVTDVVKGSALVSLVGIVDLMLATQQVIGRVYEPMPLYIVCSIIYFAINYSLSSASRNLEARFVYIRE